MSDLRFYFDENVPVAVSDFLDLAYSGIRHAGLVFGQQHKHGVGDWVKFLELVAAIYTLEEMRDRIEYL